MKPIFSHDPHAIEKLQHKLEQLEKLHQHMKEINKGHKKHGIEWTKQHVSSAHYQFYMPENRYSWNKGRFYPSWALSNNHAIICTVRKRLAALIEKKETL